MGERKNIPEIRFKGFSGEWEDRKLSSVSEYKNGKGHEDKQKHFGKYELINLNSISIDGGLKCSGKFVDEVSSTLEKGDLVMVLSDVAHGNLLGRVAIIPESNKFVLNQRVALLRPTYDVVPLFMFYNINAHQAYFKSQGAGMSQLNISRSSVEEFTSIYPDIKEQTQIGNYFEQLDNLIALHQQKYDKLLNVKKAMLEKMFPKNGADVPEIRFKGFSEKWEERTLGDIFNYERPDQYIVASVEYSDDYDTPVLTANKAFILGYTNENNLFNKPSIIFDDFTLDCKYVNFPYMVKSSAIKILIIKNEDIDNLEFSFNLLNTTKIEIMGHARHYIGVVQPTNVLVPKITEQVQIANYFKKLDTLLTLHQSQLEKLKNIKKACLEKMFV